MIDGKSVLDPPEAVVGMTEWQPDLFRQRVSVPCLDNIKAKHVSFFVRECKPYFLKISNVSPVQQQQTDSDEKGERRRVLLDPDKVKSFSDIKSPAFHEFVVKVHGGCPKELSTTEVDLDHTSYKPRAMLKKVLSLTEEDVSGYSLIGHICHLNLRECLEPYKLVIGQILLLLPNVKTVVNKINSIDNTYRNFAMETLAGQADNYMVSVKENGVKFEMDFSKVYWNPRLSTEHDRLVGLLEEGDVLYDVFAGVGPFAVYAAVSKSGSVEVHANDLNPESFKWLQHNMKLNKVDKESDKTHCYNLDGNEFIRTAVREGLEKRLGGDATSGRVRVAMNLPDTAIQFLPAFKGLLSHLKKEDLSDSLDKQALPLVYVYAFTAEDDFEGDLKRRCRSALGSEDDLEMKVDFVRNVAPKKNMYRVTIPLNNQILFDESSSNDDKNGSCSSSPKRQKIES